MSLQFGLSAEAKKEFRDNIMEAAKILIEHYDGDSTMLLKFFSGINRKLHNKWMASLAAYSSLTTVSAQFNITEYSLALVECSVTIVNDMVMVLREVESEIIKQYGSIIDSHTLAEKKETLFTLSAMSEEEVQTLINAYAKNMEKEMINYVRKY